MTWLKKDFACHFPECGFTFTATTTGQYSVTFFTYWCDHALPCRKPCRLWSITTTPGLALPWQWVQARGTTPISPALWMVFVVSESCRPVGNEIISFLVLVGGSWFFLGGHCTLGHAIKRKIHIFPWLCTLFSINFIYCSFSGYFLKVAFRLDGTLMK